MFDCTSPDSDFSALLEGGTPREGVVALGRALVCEFPGRIAVVSSFGAESAVLLALVAEIEPATPVLFVDTGQHFAETLAYRDRLARHLGLTDVRTVGPGAPALRAADPEGELWRFDPDACCDLRKVGPLQRALAPFHAWVTGRKRHQTAARAALPFRETVEGRVKINPLADWTAADVAVEMRRRGLPRHLLSGMGYPSIGCATCTRAVAAGEDPRSGRWAGFAKTECGIHRLGEAAD